jgi:predicted DNA binding CopG/RHH family protein
MVLQFSPATGRRSAQFDHKGNFDGTLKSQLPCLFVIPAKAGIQRNMQKKDNELTGKREELPEAFQSIAEAGAFWDKHDSADYEELMEDVDFETDVEERVYLVPVAGKILKTVRKKAKAEGLSTETFVNLLLQEHSG